jgi:hypothetical protein
MAASEREGLERQLAEAMPARLDLALPLAERLAAVEPTRLALLEDLMPRLEAATRRHRALEDAFSAPALAPLAAALAAVSASADRRSDDEALLVLAAAELERRRAQQADLRQHLAAVPRDQLDQALQLLRRLGDLDPDGPEGREAAELLRARTHLIDLHQRAMVAMAEGRLPALRAMLAELAALPRRLPDSAGVEARGQAALAQTHRLVRSRRLMVLCLVVVVLLIAAIGVDVALRHWRAADAVAGAR